MSDRTYEVRVTNERQGHQGIWYWDPTKEAA